MNTEGLLSVQIKSEQQAVAIRGRQIDAQIRVCSGSFAMPKHGSSPLIRSKRPMCYSKASTMLVIIQCNVKGGPRNVAVAYKPIALQKRRDFNG